MRFALRGLLCARWAAVAFFALALRPSPAAAAPITLDFVGEGKVGIAGIHSPGLGDITVYAGELLWKIDGTLDVFYTYCADVNNWVRNPQLVTAGDTSTLNNAGVIDAGGKAAWLVETYAQDIHLDPTKTGVDAAGLQVAIWEALYDNTPNLNAGFGNFYLLGNTPADVTTAALDYLNALFYAGLDHPDAYRTASTIWYDAPSGLGQDQMIPNPEPTSIFLLGSGLVAALAARRQRHRA